MNASNKPSIPPVSADAVEDEDLAEQARPGHGVPSQDPDAAAQYQLSPQDAQRESRSVFIGGGVLAGAAAGAAAGAVIAGPVGVVVGGTVGSVAGALGGAAAGAVAPAESAQSQWKARATRQQVFRVTRAGRCRPCVARRAWTAADASRIQGPVHFPIHPDGQRSHRHRRRNPCLHSRAGDVSLGPAGWQEGLWADAGICAADQDAGRQPGALQRLSRRRADLGAGAGRRRPGVQVLFLLCVLVAGLYGAATASRKILWVQAVPAAVSLLALYLGL